MSSKYAVRLLIVVCLASLAACNPPGPAPSPQPAALSPTHTPSPTSTALSPRIETPAPTATPQPPPTLTSTPAPGEAPPPTVALQKVWVALQPIPRGGEFAEGTLGLRDWPTANMPPDVIGDKSETVGRVAARDILQGEPILRTMLTPKGAAGQAALLTPQSRVAVAFTGFQSPVYITHDGEASRLFVVEKAGRIRLIENGSVQPMPFLDITDRVGSKGSEQGLLSVAFPSDYAASGLFYVDYTDLQGNTVIARYRRSAENPRQADPTGEQKILQIDQSAPNHNGGQLQFGPDGYLYIGMGDGGRAGDPWDNAQNMGVLLGKILRINVAGTDTYTIPADNPFIGRANTRPEIWALGVRNPWRFSFDRVTGDLYIADVGQDKYEEVDFQPAHSPGGQNYGWNRMEGNHCFNPPSDCDSAGTVLPVAEYGHTQGCSITGGYVYRGTRYPQMAGIYFFADFCLGNVWGLQREASGGWRTDLLLDSGLNVSSFGEDATGEIYLVGYQDGTIYHLTAAP